MRALFAFFKKELLEALRTWKLLLTVALFFLFGAMNPAIAKITPWLMEMMSDALAESGMNVAIVESNALSSWAQFFKNIPMALIAFVLIFGGTFTKEYSSGTLVLLLCKGLARYKVILAKTVTLIALWTLGYFFSYAVTCFGTSIFWETELPHLTAAVLCYYLFGVFVIALTVLCSILTSNYGLVLLGTGGAVLVCYLLGIIPYVNEYLPTMLLDSTSLLLGASAPEDYTKALIVTAVLSVAAIAASVPLFRKKRI